MMEFVEIIPHLYLSNFETVEYLFRSKIYTDEKVQIEWNDIQEQNKRAFQRMQQTNGEILVIGIGCEISTELIPKKFSYYSFPEYEDSPSCYLLSLCLKLLPLIHCAIDRSEDVIIHCVYGQSRSVTLILCYLLHSSPNYTLESAFFHVKDKKANICVNPGFLTQLRFYQQYRDACLDNEKEEHLYQSDEIENIIGKRKPSTITELNVSLYERLFHLLNETYEEFCKFPSWLEALPSINILKQEEQRGTVASSSGSMIICEHCHHPLLASSETITIPDDFFDTSLLDKLNDDFWKSYYDSSSRPCAEFCNLLQEGNPSNPSHDNHEMKKKKQDIHSKNKATIRNRQDLLTNFQTTQEILSKEYYIVAHLTERSHHARQRYCLYQCPSCHNTIGKIFLKSYPVFGRYCLLDCYLLMKNQCRVVESQLIY